MARIKVGVVRGGPSSEYEVSLKTGGAVLRYMPDEYEPKDILITKGGDWHMDGAPFDAKNLPHHVDVVFNGLHGEYGEDGTIQQLLDSMRVPYTGSTAFPSALGMNKALAKTAFKNAGLKVPFGQVYSSVHGTPEAIAKAAFNLVPSPWVVKPVSRGSSVGVSLAGNYAQLVEGLRQAFESAPTVMVEQQIKGREATVGVIENFRGQAHYVPPPIQIIPPTHKPFFDYEAKYGGETREVCPGHFTRDETRMLEDLARRAHKALGLRHYSRSDFIVSSRGIYILEANTLPGLTDQSLIPKALDAVGCSYSEFLDHLLKMALNRK